MRRVALLLALPLFLAGCGEEASDPSPSPSGASSSAPASSLPEVSPEVTVEGGFGERPTLEFPDGEPAAVLQETVLVEGDGEVVEEGDLLVVNYLGQVWGGEVFDSSYDRGAPASFPIGTGGVIPGWDEALVGSEVGDRVLLSIPPEKGYGEAGQPEAGIKGEDTLVFVIDVLGTFGQDATADPDGAPGEGPPAGVTVEGEVPDRPTVSVSPGTTPPSEPSVTVLSRGEGPPVVEGPLVVQYEVVPFSGEGVQSTWETGTPEVVEVTKDGAEGAPPFSALLGVPLGSRVLLLVPAPPGTQGDPAAAAAAAVLDLVAQPGTAAS